MSDVIDAANVTPALGRKMWRTLEPVHGMIYFVPEADDGYQAVGLMPGSGYFPSRAAPMGAVPAEVVMATFFNFHPDLVRRSIPGAWLLASPAELVQARLEAADRALRRILGAAVDGPEVAEAATLARSAATAPTLRPDGRPLYAGHAALPWPEAPHLALWHAISVLREFRGDGHVAALVAADVSGLEALVLHAATGEIPRPMLQSTRAWSDDEWDEAAQGLAGRGWVDGQGALTQAGQAHRAWVEDRTDVTAVTPWAHLGPAGCLRLRELVRPLSKAIVAAGTFAVGSR